MNTGRDHEFQNRRKRDLDDLYELIELLGKRVGGPRRLGDCTGSDGWPGRGVYVIFEEGEYREDGRTPRIVRVGTHALKTGSRSTLWGRLAQHRGPAHGGGSHRGSVFRLHVGAAMLVRDDWSSAITASWSRGSTAPKEVTQLEEPLERAVSQHVADMAILWIAIGDSPGPQSDRGVIERNMIALLSNADRSPVDPPSPTWLGMWSQREDVRSSGLWNVKHVRSSYEPSVVALLARYADQ